jgi:hypothetical protein
MNKERRLLLKEIVAEVERAERRVHEIWIEEESAYDRQYAFRLGEGGLHR